MDEITNTMKRIEDILLNRITIEDIPSVIEWFIEEPEWEKIFWTEYTLREMSPNSKNEMFELPMMNSLSGSHFYPTKF